MLLKKLCKFSKGIQLKRDETNTTFEIPYLHYGDIYKIYDVKLNLDNEIDSIIKVNSSYYNPKYQINNNDIVMNLTSENYSDLGKCILIKNYNNRKFLAGMETNLIKIISNEILPDYLNYYFESKNFINKLQQYAYGMKVFRIRPNDILNFDIFLPAISEQQHIVDIIVHLIYSRFFYLKLHFLVAIFLIHLKLLLFFPLSLLESYRWNHQYQHIYPKLKNNHC